MSRLETFLGILSGAAQAASAVADWQAGRHVQAELEHHRHALQHERERNSYLERRCVELRENRDHWLSAHDELAAEVARLREEVETMAKPTKPKKCPKCGKTPCKCKGGKY